MHPRNIYRKPPDFKNLAIKYPNFCSYVKIGLSGTAKLDFKDPAALAELTKTLLLEDFNLNVEIPVDKLIPTLPLRLNYILWMEDLLAGGPGKEIKGIDIGTGASCIYPLLGAKRGWKMFGTEIDPTSVEIAKRNVEKNSLGHLITVKQVPKNETVFKAVIDDETIFDFTMCNPPFFHHAEIAENRTKHRAPPSNAHTGVKGELETEGGETTFVSKIIEESLTLKNRIKIFSTMLGKLSSLKILRAKLRQLGVKNITWTEFHQGKTTRWGLAWSFLEILAEISPKKSDKPLVFDLPTGTKLEPSVQLIKKLLSDLQTEISATENTCGLSATVKAFQNTWGNQRRKRREDLQSPDKKKAKFLEPVSSSSILQFSIKCYEIDKIVSIETKYLSGSAGKDGVHQILQYLKNNWKIDEK